MQITLIENSSQTYIKILIFAHKKRSFITFVNYNFKANGFFRTKQEEVCYAQIQSRNNK